MAGKKTILILFFLISSVLAENTSQDFISFITGVILIQENHRLSSERKIQEYQQLKTITGVDIQSVVAYIKSFNNCPEKWKIVFDLLQTKINGQSKETKLN